MATQRESSAPSAEPTDRYDDRRPLDESEVDVNLDVPLDASIETPIEDALDQRAVVRLDDDEHDAG